MKHRYSDSIFSAMLVGLLTGVLALFVVGWIANIVKLVGMFGDPVSEMFVARICGVFFLPLGAGLGFL